MDLHVAYALLSIEKNNENNKTVAGFCNGKSKCKCKIECLKDGIYHMNPGELKLSSYTASL